METEVLHSLHGEYFNQSSRNDNRSLVCPICIYVANRLGISMGRDVGDYNLLIPGCLKAQYVPNLKTPPSMGFSRLEKGYNLYLPHNCLGILEKRAVALYRDITIYGSCM